MKILFTQDCVLCFVKHKNYSIALIAIEKKNFGVKLIKIVRVAVINYSLTQIVWSFEIVHFINREINTAN